MHLSKLFPSELQESTLLHKNKLLLLHLNLLISSPVSSFTLTLRACCLLAWTVGMHLYFHTRYGFSLAQHLTTSVSMQPLTEVKVTDLNRKYLRLCFYNRHCPTYNQAFMHTCVSRTASNFHSIYGRFYANTHALYLKWQEYLREWKGNLLQTTQKRKANQRKEWKHACSARTRTEKKLSR